MFGSAESWWRVTPLLEQRGFRVLALDLPGHGLSPRRADLTIPQAAEAVVETVRSVAPRAPVFAIGHSYGGLVLGAAARALGPELAVHVDAPFSIAGGQDRYMLIEEYEKNRRSRTPEHLSLRDHYSRTDVAVEARAAERFDAATSASISCGPGGEWLPEAGAIVVRADPSGWVSDADARRFESLGVDVRSIPGAAHSIWYSHFDEFVAAVPEMFGEV
ncbi:alpha/beta fold hydrolase [Microbacterium sp. LWH12-1.2]